MLDVHPPHTAVHGWRDFFIHIVTIVSGLLAISLEQGKIKRLAFEYLPSYVDGTGLYVPR
jgi:hypothetical protein